MADRAFLQSWCTRSTVHHAVFPFDETKFYALTYMLDTLAPSTQLLFVKFGIIAGSVLSLPSIFTARNVMEISGKETAP